MIRSTLAAWLLCFVTFTAAMAADKSLLNLDKAETNWPTLVEKKGK